MDFNFLYGQDLWANKHVNRRSNGKCVCNPKRDVLFVALASTSNPSLSLNSFFRLHSMASELNSPCKYFSFSVVIFSYLDAWNYWIFDLALYKTLRSSCKESVVKGTPEFWIETIILLKKCSTHYVGELPKLRVTVRLWNLQRKKERVGFEQ